MTGVFGHLSHGRFQHDPHPPAKEAAAHIHIPHLSVDRECTQDVLLYIFFGVLGVSQNLGRQDKGRVATVPLQFQHPDLLRVIRGGLVARYDIAIRQ